MIQRNNYSLEFERLDHTKPRNIYNNGLWVKCFKCGKITKGWDNIRNELSVIDINLIFKRRQNYICLRCQDNINKVFLNISQVKLNKWSENYGSV